MKYYYLVVEGKAEGGTQRTELYQATKNKHVDINSVMAFMKEIHPESKMCMIMSAVEIDKKTYENHAKEVTK